MPARSKNTTVKIILLVVICLGAGVGYTYRVMTNIHESEKTEWSRGNEMKQAKIDSLESLHIKPEKATLKDRLRQLKIWKDDSDTTTAE